MNSPKFSISLVTAGMIIFTVLCNSRLDIPSEVLFSFLVLLHVGLIWMVITILKHKPVDSYNEQLFEDTDLSGRI